QLVAWLAARFLHRAAADAAKATVALAETRARETTAEEMHTSRAQRYGYLAIESRALLAGLADGLLDPGDAEVRRRCAIEASRLRRLFAETDDVADPILHELRACADVAERRNVTVDLVALGQLPQLPVDIRRALLDAPLVALSTTASRARVTVVANPDEVVVSVLGDVAPGTRIPRISQPSPPTVTITEDHEKGQLWAQAHWTGR
ncbi:MAG: histidine kinase, partial [Pseudonocardiaceae bacterium]